MFFYAYLPLLTQMIALAQGTLRINFHVLQLESIAIANLNTLTHANYAMVLFKMIIIQ